ARLLPRVVLWAPRRPAGPSRLHPRATLGVDRIPLDLGEHGPHALLVGSKDPGVRRPTAFAVLAGPCYQALTDPSTHGGSHDSLPSRSSGAGRYDARRHHPECPGGSSASPETRRNARAARVGPPALRPDVTDGLPGANSDHLHAQPPRQAQG